MHIFHLTHCVVPEGTLAGSDLCLTKRKQEVNGSRSWLENKRPGQHGKTSVTFPVERRRKSEGGESKCDWGNRGKKVSHLAWHRALNDCQVECVLHAHFDCEAQSSCRVKHPACSMQLMSEAVQPRGFWKLASAQYEGGERGWSRNVNRDCVKAEASFSSCCFLWLLLYVLLILFWHVLGFLCVIIP